jgi:Tfp pilus assembly protein PilO
MKIKLNQHQVDIAFLTAGVILAVSYFVLIQRPLHAERRELRLERESLTEHIGSVGAIEQKLDQVNQERHSLSQEIGTMELKASRIGGLWDIMREVGSIAEQSKLKIVLIHPKVETESAEYQQSSLIIKLEGEFISFYRFLSALEKNNPMLKARSLRIEAGSEESSALAEEVHFELLIPQRLSISKTSEL